MSRYQHTNIERYKKGTELKQEMRESTIYPTVDRSVNDIYIVSNVSDRLDLLADQYYNDSSKWWVIALANGLGKGTLMVPPGIQLRIPANPTQYVTGLEDLNQ